MMTTTVAPALKVLLDKFIDYAGLFPPAALSLEETVASYNQYRSGVHGWMLHWLVVGAAELELVPNSLDGSLAVLAESEQTRAGSLETKAVVLAQRPVYCEVPLGDISKLDAVKKSGCFAKIRTGGLKPEAIPPASAVAAFIVACAERKLAFKATAGLHHPVRAVHKLTYEAGAPEAVMHGFLNVLLASAFAWNGDLDIEPIVAETDPSAFSFDDSAHWRGRSLTVGQIREARLNFMHSLGSCSFTEPVADLQALGLI